MPSHSKAIAIVISAVFLLGLGTLAAVRLGNDSAPSGQNQSVVRSERARNSAAAQAACYSAGGTWEQRGSVAFAVGPEVHGTCVSAAEVAQRKTEDEELFATCLSLSVDKVRAAAEGKSVSAYSYDVSKWIAGSLR